MFSAIFLALSPTFSSSSRFSDSWTSIFDDAGQEGTRTPRQVQEKGRPDFRRRAQRPSADVVDFIRRRHSHGHASDTALPSPRTSPCPRHRAGRHSHRHRRLVLFLISICHSCDFKFKFSISNIFPLIFWNFSHLFRVSREDGMHPG